MAIIHCVACGHEVSEQAASCPNCGQPIARKSGAGTTFKVIGIVATVIVAIIVVLAVIAGHNSSSASTTPPAPPKPAPFQISAQSSRDDECTQLGDYCIRVHCTYVNAGSIAADETAGAQFFDHGQSIAVRQGTLTLLPGASKEVYFDFPEAELEDGHHYTYQCLAPQN
jgi:predicted nucleic acid-binding Zn ribbon protein